MIYKDQTAVRLILRTGIDFTQTPPDTAVIKFIKPDGTASQWDATALPGSETNGDLYIDFSDLIKFDAAGRWILWAEIIFPDGRLGIGTKKSYLVE